jgi:hypothetical protein
VDMGVLPDAGRVFHFADWNERRYATNVSWEPGSIESRYALKVFRCTAGQRRWLPRRWARAAPCTTSRRRPAWPPPRAHQVLRPLGLVL